MLRSSLLCCAGLLSASLAAPADDYRFSGPYTHDNLSVFLIHGAKGQPGKGFLTLQEALDRKKVVVYETGNVNQLAVENLSSEDVYIQSGDIVKGGQQDRVFPDDFVLPSKSGRVPIASFCVEQGRWTRRGSERADRFSASTDSLPTKSLKMAARKSANQQEVWEQVGLARAEMAQAVEVQARTDGTHLGNAAGAGAGGGVGGGVAGGVASAMIVSASPTSMQLALENRKVNEAADAYIKPLSKIIDGRTDVVGYAFAINGKLNSADIYASRELFQRMWPKLLKASAIEAMAARGREKSASPPDAQVIQAAFAEAERGHQSSKNVNQRLDVVMKETDQAVLFETRDRQQSGTWIHKSYVMK
jgi:hypothetical protein